MPIINDKVLEEYIASLDEDLAKARESGSYSAVASLQKLKAQVHGHIVQKTPPPRTSTNDALQDHLDHLTILADKAIAANSYVAATKLETQRLEVIKQIEVRAAERRAQAILEKTEEESIASLGEKLSNLPEALMLALLQEMRIPDGLLKILLGK
jgi:hypothetical protein